MRSLRATIGPKSSKKDISSHNSPSKDSKMLGKSSVKQFNVLYSSVKEPKSQNDETRKRVYIDHQTIEGYINKIYSYIVTNNFQHTIKKSSLKIPSLTVFNNILIFLLNRLDKGVNSLELGYNEFIDILTDIGCPMPLQKGLFEAYGIPNNWSLLLGVLNWLIEVAEEKDRLEEMVIEEYSDESGLLGIDTDLIINQVLEEYKTGNKQNTEKHIDETYHTEYEELENSLKLLEQGIENVKMKTDDLINSQASVKDLKSIKSTLQYEKESLDLNLKTLIAAIKEATKEKTQMISQIDQIDKNITKSKDKIVLLENRINSQGMTLDESKRLSDAIQGNKAQLDKLRSEIKQKKEREHDLLTDINKRIYVLHENIKELNRIADLIKEVKLIELDGRAEYIPYADIEAVLDYNMGIIREICSGHDNEIYQLEEKDTNVRFELNGLERDVWDISARIEEIRINIDELRASEEKIKQKTMDSAKVALESRNDYTNSVYHLDKEISGLNDSLLIKGADFERLSIDVERIKSELHMMEEELLAEKEHSVKMLMTFKGDVQHLLKVRIAKNSKIIEGLNEQDSSVDS